MRPKELASIARGHFEILLPIFLGQINLGVVIAKERKAAEQFAARYAIATMDRHQMWATHGTSTFGAGVVMAVFDFGKCRRARVARGTIGFKYNVASWDRLTLKRDRT